MRIAGGAESVGSRGRPMSLCAMRIVPPGTFRLRVQGRIGAGTCTSRERVVFRLTRTAALRGRPLRGSIARRSIAAAVDL